MDFEAFMRDIAALDRVNRELEQVKDPEYIKQKTNEVFGNLLQDLIEQMHNDIEAIIGKM